MIALIRNMKGSYLNSSLPLPVPIQLKIPQVPMWPSFLFVYKISSGGTFVTLAIHPAVTS